ncbi:hypothetical protein QVA66_01865 [Staphylococcus chromogenes]|nr:hypothetical protein [Staphylococcus chromogenes]
MSANIFAKPAALTLLIMAVLSLIFTPMIKMQPRDIPVAIHNNDVATSTPAGPLKLSDKVAAGLADNKMLRIVDRDEDAYAVYTIPADFSATAAKKEQPHIDVEINQGKHPMVSQMLEGALSKAPADGPKMNVTYRNPVPPTLGLAGSLLPALFVLLTFIPTMIGSFVLANSIRARKIGLQLAALMVLNIGVGLMGWLVYSLLSPVEFAAGTVLCFLAFASFVVGSLTVGAVNLFGKPGIAIPALCLITGMSLMTLPREFVPNFWRDWIYPWNPIRMIAESGREILYQGSGIVTSPFWLLALIAGIGVFLMLAGFARASEEPAKV